MKITVGRATRNENKSEDGLIEEGESSDQITIILE